MTPSKLQNYGLLVPVTATNSLEREREGGLAWQSLRVRAYPGPLCCYHDHGDRSSESISRTENDKRVLYNPTPMPGNRA